MGAGWWTPDGTRQLPRRRFPVVLTAIWLVLCGTLLGWVLGVLLTGR